MLGYAVVVVLFAGLVFAPWLLARLRLRARLRRAHARWGEARGVVPAATGEVVTLRGRLEAPQPCTSFDGEPAAAATVWHRLTRRFPSGEAHLRAPELHLLVNGTKVRLEGPVRVAVGAREAYPRRRLHRLPLAVRNRVHDAVREEGARWTQSHVRFRSVAPGDEVRVRGRLEREVRAGEGEAHYREGAEQWKVIPADEEKAAAIEVIAERHREVRFPRRVWVLRTLVAGVLVLGVLPWALSEAGDALRTTANDRLRDCDPSGFDVYPWADRVYALQSVFPLWRGAGLEGRLRAVGSVVNGVDVCGIGGNTTPEQLDRLVDVARTRLPRLSEGESFDDVRSRLEETLHEHGRDRTIVALRAELPAGGDVTQRIRAHVYIGDLEGAADTWREPGARMDARLALLPVQKGNVLCMAGDYDGGLAAFEALAESDLDSQELDVWGDDLHFLWGECAVRAEELELAEELADAAAGFERGAAAASWIRARAALARGDEAEALRQARASSSNSTPHALLAASLLAESGRWDELRAFSERSELGFQLGRQRADAGLYNTIYHPPLDLARLEDLAVRLAAAAEDESESSEAAEPERGRPPRPLRLIARDAYVTLALHRARRWDPAAEQAFARARALDRDDGAQVERLRAVFAFFHGDWDDLDEAGLLELDRLARAYRGDGSVQIERPNRGNPLGLYMLNPSELSAEREIAHLHRDDSTPDRVKLERLRDQKQDAPLPTLFYRYTHLIVHGPRWGADPAVPRKQLEDLRAMVDAQPNPYLLTGLRGSSGL